MSRPIMTIISYDQDGKMMTIEHQVMKVGTVDFGDGEKPIEEMRQETIAGDLISVATETVVKELIDAFEIDVATERQRIATEAQAVADRAAADATAAKVLADDLQTAVLDEDTQ